MNSIIVTDSGIEFGIAALACRREGECFLLPANVRRRKSETAYDSKLADDLIARIIELGTVQEIPGENVGVPLDAAIDGRLEHVCAQYMRKRKAEGCNAGDEPRYLDRARRDIQLYSALTPNVQGECMALVSGLTRKYFEAAGIPCITDSEITSRWEKTNLYNKVVRFDRENFFVSGCLPPLLVFVAPLLFLLLVHFLWFFISPAVEAVTGFVIDNAAVWRIAILLWSIGVGLYLFRSRQRFWYGVAETLFGVALSYVAFPKDNPDYTLSKLLAVVGALYVMVRGLDNIGRSLTCEAAIKVWRWVFGDNYK